MSASARIGEFMKAYSVVIVLFVMYSGIIEFSNGRAHGGAEILIWVVLASVGVYGILTFVIIAGLDF